MSNGIDKYLHQHMNKEAGILHNQKRTKIVATVGPSCNTYEKLLQLVNAGANVFRLNFSHGSHEEKKPIIEHIREIIKNEPFNIGIIADLQGPKLRVGELETDSVRLNDGDELILTSEKVKGNSKKIFVSYPNLVSDIQAGERIFLDDGKMELEVIKSINSKELLTRINLGGTLLPRKGVNFPDSELTMPSLTEKDLEDLDFIIEQKIDWVALSFVRKTDDIRHLKKIIRDRNCKTKVIAKIEMPEALKNIRDIIIESDGIMIARGDLGVEMPMEKVPIMQKDIIRKCMRRAKPVIVATQMMESMIERTKPNRSEVTDVANAVLEGTDAVMLSGETASGQHPVLVVETMRKIIMEAENSLYDYDRDDILAPQPHSPSFMSDALCYSACKLAHDAHADALIGMTQSGYTGFMLSSYRPKCPLYIFSKEKSLISQLSLSWGVRAFHYGEEVSLDDIFSDQINILKERGFVKAGNVVVNTGSTPINLHLPTNVVKVSKVD